MPRTPDPAPAPSGIRTFADFLHWLGDVPPQRVFFRPPPGMANVNDALRVERHENKLCELISGVLVEKPLGYKEAAVAAALLAALEKHVAAKKLGVVTGPEGFYRLGDHLARVPAVAFCAAGTFRGDIAPGEAGTGTIPQFVAEITDGNAPGEVARQLEDYFAAGVKLAWIIDLTSRSVMVHTSPTKSKRVAPSGTLEVGRLLGGFKLPVRALFEHMGTVKRRR